MLTRRDALKGLSLAAVAAAAAPILEAPASGAPALTSALRSVHGLGGGLYGQVARSAGNLAISPFSVAVALGMTVNGAAGRTRSEMLDVLHAGFVTGLDRGLAGLTSYVDSLAGPVAGGDGRTHTLALDSANALFGQTGERWGQPFLDALEKYYGAGMLDVDWERHTETARKAVNTWTSDHTRHRITDILPPGSVSTDTRLVLVDALYFKAPWQSTFDRRATTRDDFTLGSGTTVPVPTMHQRLSASYAARSSYQALQLPYAGGTVAMTLLLPRVSGLDALEARVAGGHLPGMLRGLRTAEVSLSLPRWTFRTQVSLAAELAALGMPLAFTRAADFSRLTTQERLKIDSVLHQVFVAVDEAGTEAAAATAVGVGTTAVPSDQVDIAFDRPFLFVLHDLEHGTPLFVGRVADPRG